MFSFFLVVPPRGCTLSFSWMLNPNHIVFVQNLNPTVTGRNENLHTTTLKPFKLGVPAACQYLYAVLVMRATKKIQP